MSAKHDRPLPGLFALDPRDLDGGRENRAHFELAIEMLNDKADGWYDDLLPDTQIVSAVGDSRCMPEAAFAAAGDVVRWPNSLGREQPRAVEPLLGRYMSCLVRVHLEDVSSQCSDSPYTKHTEPGRLNGPTARGEGTSSTASWARPAPARATPSPTSPTSPRCGWPGRAQSSRPRRFLGSWAIPH